MSKKRHRRSFHEAGHAHELTFSCYRRFPFLKADRVCEWLAESIHNARTIHSFRLWAYVFMPDHVHLLIYPDTAEVDIGRVLKLIKAPVARQALKYLRQHSPDWLQKLERSRGAKTEHLLWQSGGGYDRNVENPDTLLAMIDYIHANPVRKGLVERPDDWKWSSAAWYSEQTEGQLFIDSIPRDWLE
ncbi:REP-associated tyrosine transposase [Rubinisphaera sp. JC750]|uniref:REP-associated tyrosine transposase n=1 Tax=Rubinisphaera sp. JC750 TaxID=2898658 RepID=UPI001F019A9C|nr:transposase [Rubinisphaera sp. JC750]